MSRYRSAPSPPDSKRLKPLDGHLRKVAHLDAAGFAAQTDVEFETLSISDQDIAQAIVDGGYGTQRISSHYMINGMGSGTLPLSSSFAFFGQRYVIDSHVFSNVVFDRAGGGGVKRMMPDPLDAAYAALGNDQAGMLLETELSTYDYASDLQSMRVIVDSEPDSFWDKNLYNR